MVAWNEAGALRNAALGRQLTLTALDDRERKVRRDFWAKLKRVIGMVPEYGQLRTFAVDRIEQLSLTEERFEPLELPDDAFAHSLGVNQGTPERVEIDFAPRIARYVRERNHLHYYHWIGARPPYFQAWGHPRKHWDHRAWHEEHHGYIRRHHW